MTLWSRLALIGILTAFGLATVAAPPAADASGLDQLVRAPAPGPEDLAGMARVRAAIDRTLASPPRTGTARAEVALSGARLLLRLHAARLGGSDGRFTVWTPPGGLRDSEGGNPALRADLARLGEDARRLARLAAVGGTTVTAELLGAQTELLRLTARYRAYIVSNWPLSEATAHSFETTRTAIETAMIDSGARRQTRLASWAALAGAPPAKPRASPRPAALPNPFLTKVDSAIGDPAARAAIRAVQPAAVHLGNGSGVNIAASGLILTNAHVVKTVGTRQTITFPDGLVLSGRATVVDAHLDLALVAVDNAPRLLPFAPLAARAPTVGTWVAVIGQPGRWTPSGEPTGYERFHVSTGRIEKLLPNPLGSQRLGRAGHSAWTYWGHSGSPLFNREGAIVALHNSWDSRNAMRHAIPLQAITHFLDSHGVRRATH